MCNRSSYEKLTRCSSLPIFKSCFFALLFSLHALFSRVAYTATLDSVTLNDPTAIASDSITLTWDETTTAAADFSAYIAVRSTQAGFTGIDTLLSAYFPSIPSMSIGGKFLLALLLFLLAYRGQFKRTGFMIFLFLFAFILYASLPVKAELPGSIAAYITSKSNLSITDTGLAPGHTYYYKVYVIAQDKTIAASNEVSATTAFTVIDVDGNVYNSVIIGTQNWMKENLRVTKYRNGDVIGTTSPPTKDISGENAPKYQWAYNGDEGNAAIYGRLYTWHALTDERGICPTGWHVPADTEWVSLTDYLGGTTLASGKMKEAGTTHWNSPNTGADNSSGFTALPGGYRYYHGNFDNIGTFGDWWSVTEYSAADAWSHFMYYNYSFTYRNYVNKSYGFSVRCVRD